jgi:4-amino-4-deoxychorismate synthase (2-amino-4-deoxychorismate-forming) component I
VAPTVRSFSAELDPLGLVASFPHCYPGILESGATSAAASRAAFDILPIRSGESLRLGRDGVVSGPHSENSSGFLHALDRWWAQLRLDPQPAALPFSGGWFVYLGYEIASEIESRLRLPAGDDPIVALALRTPAAWVRDRASHRAWLVAESGYEFLLDRFEAHAATMPAPALRPPASLVLEEEEPERFLTAVRRALEYIAAGDVYQANLSRRWHGESLDRIDPAAVHARLRAANPAPFAALLRDGDFAVISSSPERLFEVRGNVISTRPIAGTHPRGASADEDLALIRALCDSEKERAEHIMLIDLERNDLGRVCSGGTVHVDEYMTVETYAHVHHIVSNVRGRLRAGVSPVQVIRALFPGGTITGCPKVRCMQIIGELEGAGRGAYTGSIGYINRDGSCDFNILIRTITADSHALRFSAGAGIVADSIPAQELAETRAKAEGMLRALVLRP